MYELNVQDGYIISIVHNVFPGNLTGEKYQQIKALLNTRPVAPEGYCYRLREDDLCWELCERLPVTEEDWLADEEDYRAALAEMGVVVHE